MKKRYIVDLALCVASFIFAAVIIASVVGMIISGRYGSAVVFFLIAVVFLVVSAEKGTIVTVDETGISRCTAFFFKKKKLKWEDIREIGVCGLKISLKNRERRGQRHPGTLFLYVSPEELDEDGRFGMILKWPPKDKIYLKYEQDRMLAIQTIWSSNIQIYNAGDFTIEAQPKN